MSYSQPRNTNVYRRYRRTEAHMRREINRWKLATGVMTLVSILLLIALLTPVARAQVSIIEIPPAEPEVPTTIMCFPLGTGGVYCG